MKIFTTILLVFALFLQPAYANVLNGIKDFFGVSLNDLEAAKRTGMSGVVPLARDEAYKKVLHILADHDILVYQKDKDEEYIVAMGFPKHTSTTRVGIFFGTENDGKTSIELSSLSSSAMLNAYYTIFSNIE